MNMGWAGGAHATGNRISLKNTRAIIAWKMSGSLSGVRLIAFA
jgi:ATP-dependent phosphoenolpyruvate carboxykinase